MISRFARFVGRLFSKKKTPSPENGGGTTITVSNSTVVSNAYAEFLKPEVKPAPEAVVEPAPKKKRKRNRRSKGSKKGSGQSIIIGAPMSSNTPYRPGTANVSAPINYSANVGNDYGVNSIIVGAAIIGAASGSRSVEPPPSTSNYDYGPKDCGSNDSSSSSSDSSSGCDSGGGGGE